MKTVLGVLLCVSGILLGLYVGVWLCLIGGIVQFVEGVKANPVNAWEIAFGIARFIGAGFCGVVSCCMLFVPGLALAVSSRD
jgi:hypothetical protein